MMIPFTRAFSFMKYKIYYIIFIVFRERGCVLRAHSGDQGADPAVRRPRPHHRSAVPLARAEPPIRFLDRLPPGPIFLYLSLFFFLLDPLSSIFLSLSRTSCDTAHTGRGRHDQRRRPQTRRHPAPREASLRPQHLRQRTGTLSSMRMTSRAEQNTSSSSSGGGGGCELGRERSEPGSHPRGWRHRVARQHPQDSRPAGWRTCLLIIQSTFNISLSLSLHIFLLHWYVYVSLLAQRPRSFD